LGPLIGPVKGGSFRRQIHGSSARRSCWGPRLPPLHNMDTSSSCFFNIKALWSTSLGDRRGTQCHLWSDMLVSLYSEFFLLRLRLPGLTQLPCSSS
jgi:hypothetical protein